MKLAVVVPSPGECGQPKGKRGPLIATSGSSHVLVLVVREAGDYSVGAWLYGVVIVALVGQAPSSTSYVGPC